MDKIKTIKWRDSNLYITQCARDDVYEVAVITSTGFLIEEDDEKVVLAGDLVGDELRRVIVIPKENII